MIDVPSSSSSDEDEDRLAQALDALTLASSRMQQFKRLPFLLRNIRKGFRRRCEKAGIKIQPNSAPATHVGVVYRYDWDAAGGAHHESGDESDHIFEEWKGGMAEWTCPLCQLHGHFTTRERLEFHMKQDHSETRPKWIKRSEVRLVT